MLYPTRRSGKIIRRHRRGHAPVTERLEDRLLLALEPNLTVDVIGPESAYSVGQYVQATARITNEGNRLAGGFTIRFYFWRVSTGTGTAIEDGVVAGLAAGFTVNNAINVPGFRIPQTTVQGNYRIRVYVDVLDKVDESNENDNAGFSSTFFVYRPDLVVPDVNPSNNTYGPGTVLSAVATIRNQNAGSTLASALQFQIEYWLGNEDDDSIRKIGTGNILGMDGGVERTDRIDWVVPADVTPGRFRLCVLADSEGAVPEASESNNWGCSDYFWMVQAEIEVVSVGDVEPFYQNGRLLGASTTIRNNGQINAPPFAFKYYLGTDSNRTKYELQSGVAPLLLSGATRNDIIDPPKLITNAYDPGAYRVWVHADSGDVIPELDEEDNWGKSSVLRIIDIEELQWEDASGNAIANAVAEGTTVYLSIKARGLDTNKPISVDIWEDDAVDDELERENLLVPYDAAKGRWRTPWWPAWSKDAAGTDPEFYFFIPGSRFGFALGFYSGNISVTRRTDDFGIKLRTHTVGTGVPLVLVHGNNSDTAGNLYRWQWFDDYMRNNPSPFAEFDVYLWKHDTSKPIGFNGASGSQAASLADYVYETLEVGVQGTKYADKRLAILAHSQGGLVSRSFMNAHNAALGHKQGDDVSGLVTLGTPHHGSPFAMPDWVAAVWGYTQGTGPAAGTSLSGIINGALQTDRDGTINLAWDGLDSAIPYGWTTSFPVKSYDLTIADGNRSISGPVLDNTEYYPGELKNEFGLLETLNLEEAYYHKLAAFGAFDESLADNATIAGLVADSAAGLVSPDFSSDHKRLSAITRLLGEMSHAGAGNANESPYFANDGLVPLQSALFLDISPDAEGDAAAFSSLDGDAVEIDSTLIAARKPRDMKSRVAPDGVRDHQDILDTTNTDYWESVVDELRNLLDSTPPTATMHDPAPGGGIGARILNGRGYLDLTFADTGGSGLDPARILDTDPEFIVAGDAAVAVVFTSVERLAGNTYRYYFDGQFAAGQVELGLIANSFADDTGNGNAALGQSFYSAGDGDANFDGQVNGDDFFRIDSGFALQLPGWGNGDFNGNGAISADDYFIIDAAFATQGTPLGRPAGRPHHLPPL